MIGGEKMRNGYTVDLRVLPGGDVQTTFTQLKALQTLGIADTSSSIKFNGITLPAGAFETFEQYFQVHYAVAAKDLSNVMGLLPENLSPMALESILNSITRESQKVGAVGFTPEEIDGMVEERVRKLAEANQK